MNISRSSTEAKCAASAACFLTTYRAIPKRLSRSFVTLGIRSWMRIYPSSNAAWACLMENANENTNCIAGDGTWSSIFFMTAARSSGWKRGVELNRS